MHTEYGVPNIIKQINDHMHPTTKFEVREREFNIKIKEEATKTQLASRTVISEIYITSSSRFRDMFQISPSNLH